MAPLRRYLRLTKYSVLEVRIYIDQPALTSTWLLNPRSPVLPRIITAIRPLVIAKLREERERARTKGKGKKKAVRDVVVEEDFEVSIFLTEPSSRHSILTKKKGFEDEDGEEGRGKRGVKRREGGGLEGWLTGGERVEEAIKVPDEEEVQVLREEDEEAGLALGDIPEVEYVERGGQTGSARKRRRDEADDEEYVSDAESIASSLAFQTQREVPPAARRRKTDADGESEDDDEEDGADDKKKLGLKLVYDGFSIYNRILCLVVKRRGGKKPSGPGTPAGGSQMMETWVSTQAVRDEDDNAEEEDV